MTKKKIITISGMSGSGKDTILKELLKQDKKLKKIIATTTRIKRPQEIDGFDYHFKDDGYFELNKRDILLQEKFKVYDENNNQTIWKYGIHKSEFNFDENNIYILITTPKGVEELYNYFKDNQEIIIQSFLITASFDVRLNRFNKRNDKQSISEITRREAKDKVLFGEYIKKLKENNHNFIELKNETEYNLNKCINKIFNLI